jgi:hypothetical protein
VPHASSRCLERKEHEDGGEHKRGSAGRGFAEAVPPETLHETEVPELVLNGTDDIANQTVGRLLEAITNARFTSCEGDHGARTLHPTFESGERFLRGAMVNDVEYNSLL